jgi:hypothetical protein
MVRVPAPRPSHPVSAALVAVAVALAGAASPTLAQDTPDMGSQVGTIEATLDGDDRVFPVYEGPLEEGFATGYVDRGNPDVLYVSLLGMDTETGDRIMVHVVVDTSDGRHVCVPLDNRVVYYPAGAESGHRLATHTTTSSETCPVRPGSVTGVAYDLNVRSVSLDAAEGTVQVSGDFSGEFGRGGDAVSVEDGTFQATVGPVTLGTEGPYGPGR